MNPSEPFRPIITLTTDFGLEGAYVGSMKGVMLSTNQGVRIIDITHELPAHRILPAALVLREACPRFPPGTVHVAVIDPGVGGQRRPVLLKMEDQFYIGPDNGIFGLLLEDFLLQGAWRLDNRKYFLSSVSQTFHGRDIFAPVAAHLAGRVPPEAFGPSVSDPMRVQLPPHREEPLRLKGLVVWIDRFGNCITNLTDKLVLRWTKGTPFVVQAASKRITRICSSYDTTPKGEPLAIFNSMGFLEIACNQERADRTLGLGEGAPVVLEKVPTREALEGDT